MARTPVEGPDAGRTPRPPRVVIVGAGFAGLWAAQGLASRHDLDVTLIDQHNYHTFYPLLYQVAAAELGPSEIAYPVRSILRSAGCVRFRMAEVVGLDKDARLLQTTDGSIRYDVLALALGSLPNFFDVPGAAEHAFRLRVMEDALPLRRAIISRFELATFERSPSRRGQLLTFVIVGGGPTGVEYAGALSELVLGPVLRDYPNIPREEIRIVLVEASDRVLTGMKAELGEYAVRRLERRNVEVLLNTAVTRIRSDGVEFADGSEIRSDTVVWTAGIQGDPMVRRWGLEVGGAGRVVVDPTLQVPGHPEIFVAGDLARALGSDGQPLPQVAPVAVQQGRHLVRAIRARVSGEPVPEFRYRDPGMLAVVGRSHAVAEVFGRAFTGFPAWLLWAVIHIAKLVGFRNRVLVLVHWAWNYIFYKRAVRLILPGGNDPEGNLDHRVAAPEAREGPRSVVETAEDAAEATSGAESSL
jgi:NADH dehydrogenase